jgi:hypothetical protein
MSRRRDVGSITVAIPMDAVLAVRSSARMSRDGISDDYEGYRHKGRASSRVIQPADKRQPRDLRMRLQALRQRPARPVAMGGLATNERDHR